MLNGTPFEKGKVAFQVLLIVLFQWPTTGGQWNLYHTDQTFKTHSLHFDCLNYYVYHEILAYQGLPDVVDEVIPYCFRPTDSFDELLEYSLHPLSQKFTFEQLRMADITSLQLLVWSIPLEMVERYQFYLNEPNAALNEHIYKCTPPRFGLQCQYSFEFGEGMSFNQIVEATFHKKMSYSESFEMMTQVPCYVLLKCHRDGRPWCLDWREVCDGKIDCFDEGLDEVSCFDMEINECSEGEYRCHNGLCISEDLWENGMGDTDCLDRSDRAIQIAYTDSCFQDPTFRCEEHSCRANGNPFSCGDGQCAPTFGKCHNGRHALLLESMAVKGNLLDECWIAMLCLTELFKKINESSCETWLMNNSKTYAALEHCDPVFQFPTIPVYSHYVRFFYKDPHLKLNMSEPLLPDYVCYDKQLCNFNIPQIFHEHLTCTKKPQSLQIWRLGKNPWVELISSTEEYFRSCSTAHSSYYNQTKVRDHPSLYSCQNSLKSISKHRIMDGVQNCFDNDDEVYAYSCQLQDRYRVTCHNATKCWSPLAKSDACIFNDFYEPEEIPFQTFCDGIEKFFYDDNGKNYSDEYECGDWSCNNIYARCDGFWACADGRDEDNCSRTICPPQKYACVSPVNYTVICLLSEFVNNGVRDCLGAMDEQSGCRKANPSTDISYRFSCSDEGVCLPVSRLCDEKVDCSFSSKDNKFCKNGQFNCDQDSPHNRSDIDEYLCGLNEDEKRRIKYFSVHTSTNYPSLEKGTVGEFKHWPTERRLINNVNLSQVQHNLRSWYCHRGLIVRTWIKNNSSNDTCICPPSYYGHLCQYQNQRIGLTLRLSSNERHTTYAIISMLMDDTDKRQEINAYDQSIYIAKQSCSMKLNRYLLFPTRPKNIDSNYSVRIDIFEKNALTYVGSWHFPINFSFLPVNRLSISLNLSNHRLQFSSNCSNTCHNGECVKYVNKDQYFCRCVSNWSGRQCNIPLNCQTCSPSSICIGSASNRSICVCPTDKFGSQCLLNLTCPINACQNQGQCIPADMTIPGNNYTCLCSDRFFGENCEYRKAQVDISLDDLYIPPYLVAYFFTLSNKSDPIETTLLRKMTLFQHIVTFHIPMPYQLAFIQVNNKYYLAVLQQTPKTHIITSINPTQECISVKQLLNETILKMIPYRRILYFHLLCQTYSNLTCFIDETYLCLCTNDQHANCIKFNRQRNFQCPLNNYCINQGQCLQDHPTCPSTKICLCPNCFFGNQCQFYAKGLGSTLDEILGYEFQRNVLLSKQPFTVKMGVTVTIFLFVIGVINSILSIITFLRQKSQEVGCGIYLLASSITSLLTMILLTLKFFFLFFSQQDFDGQQNVLKGNCFGIEPLLKGFLYLDNWLNACVAIERTMTVLQGITFNKNRSRKVAIWTTILLLFIIVGLFFPQIYHLHLFYDQAEERSWCVMRYEQWLQVYSSTLIFFHYFAPLSINILSILLIILITALRGSRIQTDRSFWIHLISKTKKHKHVLISSTLIICLTLPHLIISIILDCQKSSHLLWFYLIGYFLSFCPAAFIFIIFILPSPLYRKEFYKFIAYIRRRFQIFKLNASKL